MQRTNLEEVRQGFQGRPFCKLVKHHLAHQKQDVRVVGIQKEPLKCFQKKQSRS
jgi:hypothetical protein